MARTTGIKANTSGDLFGIFAARFHVLGLLAGSVLLASCSSAPKGGTPAYDRPLRQGEHALRKIDSGQVRGQLVEAFNAHEDGLYDSLQRSRTWYAAPSSQSRFPYETNAGEISHTQATESIEELHAILGDCDSGREFAARVLERFDVYQSVGWDDQGTVLFTGYYAPIFKGSLVEAPGFRHPLFKRPDWLLTSSAGVPFGRRTVEGRIVDSPTRKEIEASNMLKGQELLWLPNRLDAYICQVNGSACIEFPDGRTVYIGYAGKTEHPYTGLGHSMMNEGLIPKEGLSLDAIQSYYKDHPATVDRLIDCNENFVFFTEYDGGGWPAGSLGVPVTTRASIATDKSIYPPGAVALVDTKEVRWDGSKQPFTRLVCDQDTGGAIVAPGRCDLFMGIGPDARVLAGGQYFEGTMYYLFRKPESLAYSVD